ncbi:MAG: hypothetical protein WB820_16445, partial [Rhodoplanes sp.]
SNNQQRARATASGTPSCIIVLVRRLASKVRVIERDYPLLRADLATLTPDRSSPLILIKKNVCQILEPKLVQDGFNVLNDGRVIYLVVAPRCVIGLMKSEALE